jgi:hypothetical protein
VLLKYRAQCELEDNPQPAWCSGVERGIW